MVTEAPLSPEAAMERFRADLQRRKDAELQEGESAHLRHIDLTKLTQQDQTLYAKWQQGQLSYEEFYVYRSQFDSGDPLEARSLFAQYIANLSEVKDDMMTVKESAK